MPLILERMHRLSQLARVVEREGLEHSLDEQARSYLTVIQSALDGAAGTVARMREFYRPRDEEATPTAVNLDQMLQQVSDLTRARWNDIPQEHGVVIEMRIDLDDELPVIVGPESEIRDALTNLVLNAVDAMPEGGTLSLRSGRRSGADGGCPAAGPPEAAYVEVGDTGIGMSEEIRMRCMEPFFTTKGERGTGLGLAMVYGMTQRHGAILEIDSAPGHGTTMRLVFPAVRAANTTGRPAEHGPLEPVRLLVVDDDPLLLNSLRDALEGDGHLIYTAEGGQAGIEEFAAAQRRGEPYAAVITDLGMPHVDGRAVAARVKSLAPTTPVILLTGWGHRLRTEPMPEHFDRVLSKPPRLAELREALFELTPSNDKLRPLNTGTTHAPNIATGVTGGPRTTKMSTMSTP